MIIQHNMNAVAAERSLNETRNQLHVSTEKLSSGYRVNSSADDAAALKISEKMRWQIRGLNRASDNIGEGEELIKVAEGALQEVHDMLQRLVELTIQAANDTNNVEDRDAIQQEINAIKSEINRISTDTEYNKIKIFEPGFHQTIKSSPRDILIYHEDSATDPRGYREGGIIYNGKRYSYESMGIKFDANGDIPEGTYQAHVLAQDGRPTTIELIFEGGNRIPSGRKYTPQADANGIRIDHILHPWSTIKNENGESLNPNWTKEGTYSFEHAGMTFSFDVAEGMSQTSLIKWVQEDLVKTYDFRSDGMEIQQVPVVDPNISISNVTINTQVAPFIPGNTDSNKSSYTMNADEKGLWLVIPGKYNVEKPGVTKDLFLCEWEDLKLDEWKEGESVNPDSTVIGGEKPTRYYYWDLLYSTVQIGFEVDSEVSKQELINAVKNWVITVNTDSEMKIRNTSTGATPINITPSIDDTKPSLHAYGTQYQMGLFGKDVQRPVKLADNTTLVDANDNLAFTMTDSKKDSNGNPIPETYTFKADTTIAKIKEEAIDEVGEYIDAYREYLEKKLNGNDNGSIPRAFLEKSIRFKSSDGYQMSFKYTENFSVFHIDENSDIFIIREEQDPNFPDDPDKKITVVEVDEQKKSDYGKQLAANVEESLRGSTFTIETNGQVTAWNDIQSPNMTENVRYTSSVTAQCRSLKIQTSYNEGDHITIPLPGMDTNILGIDDIKVYSYSEASDAIKKVHRAINIVSDIRSDLGAIHNRLVAARMVDDVIAENAQSAESKIRDMNMSSGVVEQSKNNILGSMKEAVLAQANHVKDGIATLLQ